MLAVSYTATRQASAAPANQQDTGAQRQYWAGDNHAAVTVMASGTFVAAAALGGVTYAGLFASLLFSAPELVFRRLVEQWRRERGADSSVTSIAMCPSYQRIIAMGEAAVPLILQELESEGDEPDHWFWALAALKPDADPIPDEARGDMVQMAQAWLAWGRQRYAW